MREVESFEDERLARRFADVLCEHDVSTRITETRQGGFAVWVIDERDLETAMEARTAFLAAPDAPAFRSAEGCAERRRRAEDAESRRSRHAVISVRERFRAPTTGPVPVTVFTVAASVAVTVILQSSAGGALLNRLLIGLPGEPPFARVLGGEIWRLVTPCFVHFGWMHIFFNGWMTTDLGSALERRVGGGRLAGLILLTGALSNALQYVVTANPYFGGLSGVVYALLGYIWVKGRRDPSLGLGLSRQTVVILLAWLGLGFTGLLGNIANYAHLGGLVAGLLLGLI